MDDRFFSDPRKVFLHGLLGPERVGTCSSLPVLYVAVGRQLGYPLKLVTTKGHLFVRWEGAGERFNIEATSRGSPRLDDDHYRHWPFEISHAEEQTESYLQSLTPAGELSAFLSIRGMCLSEARRFPEALESFATAARLSPQCHVYQALQADMQATLARQN
jgi:regulator of sirC expression with transglutaminase-like and TPR domain